MESEIDHKRSISILCVEDDGDILELQTSVLTVKFPDIGLYTALNGKLGLELFKAHKPDIVITDVNMPEMCGVEMADSICALKPDTKFIAITGRSKKNVQQKSDNIEFEFDYIIIKPVELSELFAVIEQCIDEIERHI